ncbi:glycosyl hydrolase family 61-domain-containing protein [Sordaria sp. MPI-SDFR-AT-0083]|nr:glycosyl hydrolase family 61-domain-containing protein [Sordaria sp. MPI-SDFR-AT-0083]
MSNKKPIQPQIFNVATSHIVLRSMKVPGMFPLLLATLLAAPFSGFGYGSGPGPALVSAHGGLANYTVDDVWYPGYDPNSPLGPLQLSQPAEMGIPQRSYASIDPLFSPTSPYIACNSPGLSPPNEPSHYISLLLGSNLTAIYYYWLHPVGPMSVWLSPCPDNDCTTVNLPKTKWFKIWEAALLGGPNLAEGTWYQKRFQKWDGDGENRWEVVVPRGLKSGRYLVRHEILSLHVAGKPQFYVECAHLDIKNGGVNGGEDRVLPPDEYWVKFPGGYRDDGKSDLSL